MQFTIRSFKGDGTRCTVVNESPAFYALGVNGMLVDYFTTMQALKLAVQALQAMDKADKAQAKTDEYDLKLAA